MKWPRGGGGGEGEGIAGCCVAAETEERSFSVVMVQRGKAVWKRWRLATDIL